MYNKKLYESIMQQVALQVKKALNEAVDESEEGVWGVEDFDFEADEDGSIGITLRRFSHGGRETMDSTWKLTIDTSYVDSWDVKAVCTGSEDRRYDVGDEVTFELYKDTRIYDIESCLQDALNDEGF